MKKTITVLFLTASLILNAAPASAKNVMSYFRTVHIIERETDITPDQMFELVKKSAKSQLENGGHLSSVNTTHTSAVPHEVSDVNIFEFLRSH